MNRIFHRISIVMVLGAVGSSYAEPLVQVDSIKTSAHQGSYFTGTYRNLFRELLGKGNAEVQAKIDDSFRRLFYGDDSTQRVYYPVGTDEAYIEDIANNDVRTEGMSYGMMIAVQLDKKTEFDRLWTWTKRHMQHRTGPRTTYFAWHCRTNGRVIDSTTASDGEEWFVTALYFASARWGNGTGIFNYKAEAQSILDAMLSKDAASGGKGRITNLFNIKEKQVVFVPDSAANGFTDPSYHLPQYYELWARWADKNNVFWCDAASTSRMFFKKAAHPATGLMPDYARFDGSALNWRNHGHSEFRFDAWRVAMNVAVDHAWFGNDQWEVAQSNRLLDFFYTQGIGKYVNQYTLDGKPLSEDTSIGLCAMNAVACLASTSTHRQEFLTELWNAPVPHGLYRYYDGMLYLMALLHVSGEFKIYDPSRQQAIECPGGTR